MLTLADEEADEELLVFLPLVVQVVPESSLFGISPTKKFKIPSRVLRLSGWDFLLIVVFFAKIGMDMIYSERVYILASIPCLPKLPTSMHETASPGAFLWEIFSLKEKHTCRCRIFCNDYEQRVSSRKNFEKTKKKMRPSMNG